jgi:glutaredoxin 3
MPIQPKVVIYSLPTCEYCKMAKVYFKLHNIAFDDIDVDKDPAAQKEMIAKSGQFGVPVIEINGQVIVGFQKNAIGVLLGIV